MCVCVCVCLRVCVCACVCARVWYVRVNACVFEERLNVFNGSTLMFSFY